MEINDEIIDHLAHLARLEFKGQAKEEIKKDLNRIVSFVEKLNELETENVEPLIYMTEEYNVLRADEVKQDVSQKEALKNAPKKDSDYFKVPRVVTKQTNNSGTV
jgi:aspartyl-tRNA(Asn)/glutamyl-tRNA(Gln) amidotransferase subunit C